MVLDTNVKSYKTSTKILCVVLCIVTFLNAMLVGAVGVLTRQYRGYNDYNVLNYNFTEATPFQNRLYSDVRDLILTACEPAYQDEKVRILKSKKDEIVEKAYNNYLLAKPFIARQQTEEDYYESSASYDELQDIDVYFSDDSSCSFSVNNLDVFNTYLANVADGENAERAYIEHLYDNFVENNDCYYDNYWCDTWAYADSMVTYAKNGESVVSNFNNVTAEEARSYPIYIIYQDGKLEYDGIPEALADELRTELLEADEITKSTTLILWFNHFPTTTQSIFNYRYWNDYYISLFKFNSLAYEANKFLPLIMISAVILLAISFVTGFSYFKMSGRRDKDDKARLTLIDKIPIEVHLLLSVILGILFCVLWTSIDDAFSTEYSIMFMIVFSCGLTVLQVLMLEFCASVARHAHSEKGIKNGFITTKVARVIKKQCKKAVALLSYKSGAMAKNAIILTVLYFLCNIVLIGLAAFLFSTFEAPEVFFAIFLFIVYIALNVYVVVKLIKYLKNLDVIITAFSSKQEPDVDIEKLPQSLKTLADSMKYTNEELQSAVEKAIKDERLRSELITNVSHDLKTPLTSIITYVDLLSKCDITDERAQEYIKVLDDKGAKLKRLIEDLIEASKVTSGNVTVNLTSINLSELCLQSTVEAQTDFEKAGLDLIVKNSENPPIVTADGAKTFRIIENLLSNARKYSAKGTRVYVEVYDTDKHGIFEVKNISAEPLDISPDELTERFVRGDKSRNQEGNGLGLSIAKELCRLQYGTLELIIDGDLFKARVKLPK